MDSNNTLENQIATSSPSAPPRNDERNIWQWLTQSPTRMAGLILLSLAFVLLLALMVIISQRPVKKEGGTNIPQANSIVQPPQNNLPSLPPIPKPAPVDTKNWNNLVNNNGFSFKYPKEATLSGYVGTATASATIQINTGESVLGVEIFDKIPSLSVEKAVELTRAKNASSSATQKILTKPIAILFAGNKGYEWYLESSKFYGTSVTFNSRQGRNRVVQFEKGDKSYILFTTFDDIGEQLLSTLRFTAGD